MDVALVGAELEENLGLRYMAAALEARGHRVEIVAFNSEADLRPAVLQLMSSCPQITGLSMVFTGRARQFCRLAQMLRDAEYRGHIVAGGHFASFNCDRLLRDFPAFDSVGLGEGEKLICDLADHIDDVAAVPGLCFRRLDGSIGLNPSTGNPDKLDELPFPKRGTFHDYYGQRIASVLTSRGCWRDCAFCSINAWYERAGGKKFRIRSIDNLVAELKDLYLRHGVRIFNFQDDNFFLPNPEQACRRFEALRDGLRREGVEEIAIAVKARPDSISRESIAVLDELGLFRVFLGVENYSENGLRNLNRKCSRDQILRALEILNDFEVHVAYNLLMFEPDTVLDDILINLRFMERHVENPFNFCRAEAYAGTGLEAKLVPEGRLLGDYFGFDYRLKDPQSEAFHQIANHAFFDRNFSDYGLHYFNMEVDFCFQLLRRFHPQTLSETLRGAVRNFIKETNLDTYQWLCRIYDYVATANPHDQASLRKFAWEMRRSVDADSAELHDQGQELLEWLDALYERRDNPRETPWSRSAHVPMSHLGYRALDESGVSHLGERIPRGSGRGWEPGSDLFGLLPAPIPYGEFKKRMAEVSGTAR
ncbi:MAG: radical SAM protein [Isosphaeraceae bacterium]|jgi:anaerobic magnesium-protoporphyrin IX monomethyl ester cyclase